jgi:ABC-2 type transport system ATP-binding protein
MEASAVAFEANEEAVAELSVALVEAGALIRSLVPQTATLEELFFKLTEDPAEPVPA